MAQDERRDEPAANWAREEMRIDDGEDDETTSDASRTGAPQDSEPGWNKEQMRIDDEDAAETRYRDPDTMLESESGPTGGRSNPGGGERFGEIDDGASEERR